MGVGRGGATIEQSHRQTDRQTSNHCSIALARSPFASSLLRDLPRQQRYMQHGSGRLAGDSRESCSGPVSVKPWSWVSRMYVHTYSTSTTGSLMEAMLGKVGKVVTVLRTSRSHRRRPNEAYASFWLRGGVHAGNGRAETAQESHGSRSEIESEIATGCGLRAFCCPRPTCLSQAGGCSNGGRGPRGTALRRPERLDHPERRPEERRRERTGGAPMCSTNRGSWKAWAGTGQLTKSSMDLDWTATGSNSSDDGCPRDWVGGNEWWWSDRPGSGWAEMALRASIPKARSSPVACHRRAAASTPD
ncbi:hypothetical protein B0T26DRAFT_274042 [Lasiosphaeria miniovina]|uniref:Uncharacterized protein n=1 Tax=Lasiosphaeria miniovina TaxID=1954250 RepID=A0AA40DUM6_9PEZI|nr:uncharacterized protein B0T26DRAFT_274042 [Lasiosphaeria miniovina]KAK0717004.1 hypothetical protein B0T26DRAFT_274042 [Lasiosphaeria miniovina]